MGAGVSCGRLSSARKGTACNADSQQDARLRRTKLFYEDFDEMLYHAPCRYPHLFCYRAEYLYPVRAMLNRKGGSMEQLLCQQRKQHSVQGFVNYLADHNGFRLLDISPTVKKHNEANGEGNKDGSDWNLSCNYGVGETQESRR